MGTCHATTLWGVVYTSEATLRVGGRAILILTSQCPVYAQRLAAYHLSAVSQSSEVAGIPVISASICLTSSHRGHSSFTINGTPPRLALAARTFKRHPALHRGEGRTCDSKASLSAGCSDRLVYTHHCKSNLT